MTSTTTEPLRGTEPARVVVRPLAVDDDAEVAAAHRVTSASARHGRPWSMLRSERELAVELRVPSTSERLEPLVALVDGEVAGVALLWFPLLDNTQFTWLELDVDPGRRGRGAGSALVEEVVARTRREGRTTVLAELNVPEGDRENHEHVRFARRHGFTYANTEIRRILELPVDPGLFQRLAAEAAAHHEGYRIETHVGRLPDHLVPSYCDSTNRLAVDAPTGEVEFEPEARTPQTYAEDVDLLHQQGRTLVHTVAITPGGEVVGYNDLVVCADDRANVMQWGTLVRAEHRGHRLGMAVKARGLAELVRLAPQARRVMTCNAEQNAHMVGVNEALGFRRVEAVLSYQRHLDG